MVFLGFFLVEKWLPVSLPNPIAPSRKHREKWQPIYVDIICRRHYVDILQCQKNRNVHPLFFDTFRHMSAKYVEKCRENLDIMSTLCRKIVSLWNYVDGIYVDKYVDICRHICQDTVLTYVDIYVGQCPGHMSSYVDRRGPRKLFFHPH